MKIPETDIEIKEKCIFCDEGKYQVYSRPSMDPNVGQDVRDLGLRTIGKNFWTILICNSCGNIQLFRQDLFE